MILFRCLKIDKHAFITIKNVIFSALEPFDMLLLKNKVYWYIIYTKTILTQIQNERNIAHAVLSNRRLL